MFSYSWLVLISLIPFIAAHYFFLIASRERRRALDLAFAEKYRTGHPWSLTYRRWVGIRCGGALVGFSLGLGAIIGIRSAPVLCLSLGTLGFCLPDILLRIHARSKQRDLVLAIPAFLDILGTCLKAGMPLEYAIKQVAKHTGGPLGEEWQRTLSEIDLHIPIRVAYQNLVTRTGSEDAAAMIQALLQASELGVPIAAVLKRQAENLRLRHRNRVRERAAKAGPQISVILALVTAPSIFLFVVSLIVLSLASSDFWGIKGLF